MELVVRNIKTQFSKVSSRLYYHAESDTDDEVTEITPLFVRDKSTKNHTFNDVELSIGYEKLVDIDDDECATNPWKRPRKSNILLFILKWPITFILWCTIPDCRRHEKLYILTFINCVLWILGVSYLIASVISSVGEFFFVVSV